MHIATILSPNVTDSSTDDNKERNEKELEHRELLSGSIDEAENDLQVIKKIGVYYAILNFNRSSQSSNIDKIIDVQNGFMTS